MNPTAIPGFVLEDLLGQGCTGAVYRARSASGQSRAVKVLHALPDPSAGRDELLAALKALAHENVATIHDFSLATPPGYLVMELCDGQDLVSYVRAYRPRDAERAAPSRCLPLAFGQQLQEVGHSSFQSPGAHGFARLRHALGQVARGLAALHQARVVHRDLRPENVRMCGERAVIVDFDNACFVGAELPASIAAGSVAYMAPEQADATRAHSTFDGYALGVLMFEALTGAPPFFGTAHEVLLRKRTAGAPAPSLLLGDVPDDLDRLCVALLSCDPERRPSAAEVAEALEPRAVNGSD